MSPRDVHSYAVRDHHPALSAIGLNTDEVAQAVVTTNNYLVGLNEAFCEVGYDMFRELGQRNISGVIGSIFAHILADKSEILCVNPHPDGHPDVLLLDCDERIAHFQTCFLPGEGRLVPLKERFSPFAYPGVEVKCTIGDQVSTAKQHVTFDIGVPRGPYLNGLTYWAHHQHCAGLLGVYYDYHRDSGGIAQVLAAFYAELDTTDWSVVSLGKTGSKKTSNSALLPQGKRKMLDGWVVVTKDEPYAGRLATMGVPPQVTML